MLKLIVKHVNDCINYKQITCNVKAGLQIYIYIYIYIYIP
jgi:hypothetical protein